MARGEEDSFEFVLDDPTGNSFVQNPHAPVIDPRAVITYYERTKAQMEECGFLVDDDEDEGAQEGKLEQTRDTGKKKLFL